MLLSGDPDPLCDLLPAFDHPPGPESADSAAPGYLLVTGFGDPCDRPGDVVVDFLSALIHGSPSLFGEALLLDSPLSIIAAISAGNCLVGVFDLPGMGIGLFGASCCHGIAGRGFDCMLDTSSDCRLVA